MSIGRNKLRKPVILLLFIDQTHFSFICITFQNFSSSKISRSVSTMTSEQIKEKISDFAYFDEWSQDSITQLCKVSILKKFLPDCVIIGGSRDQKSYVHFITEGRCQVIECLNLSKKKYFVNVAICIDKKIIN